MSCDWEAKLDQYVDSELPESESNAVRAHLLTCATCAAGALSRLRTKQMNRIAGQRFRPSVEFRRRVEQSIAPRRAGNWITRWPPVFATAALVVVVAVAGLRWQQSRADQQALGELADLHVSTLASANRVDVVSSDRHTVKPWFQGRIPFTFNLPELKDTSFQLIGGRVVYFHQSAGAHLLFASGKHDISVFIFQNRGAGPMFDARSGQELTFHAESWTAAGLRYVLISDIARPELHRLSELLRSAATS